VMRAASHRLRRLGGRAGQAAAREHRQVDELVAHESGRRGIQAVLLQYFPEDEKLVVDSLVHFADAELARAQRDRGRAAAREQRDGDAGGGEHLEAVAVVRGKGLERLAARAVPEGAVREDAVDVENHQADAPRPSPDLLSDLFQITLARNRSCMLSAPTSSPPASITSSWFTLCASISCTASTASASDRIMRGAAVITSATRAVAKSAPFSRARRRSPSVKMPRTLPSAPRTAVMPMRPRVISCSASLSGVDSATSGTPSPLRMTSPTCSSAWRGSRPRGWLRAKSSLVKPRASSSATASASPRASAAVVLAVGARLCV